MIRMIPYINVVETRDVMPEIDREVSFEVSEPPTKALATFMRKEFRMTLTLGASAVVPNVEHGSTFDAETYAKCKVATHFTHMLYGELRNDLREIQAAVQALNPHINWYLGGDTEMKKVMLKLDAIDRKLAGELSWKQ